MIDYIIVGSGLAGIAFCEQLEKNRNSFVVFDDNSQQSSSVAGGLYNPVILKRFTEVWKAKEQLTILTPYYKQLEDKLAVTLDYKIPIWRRFTAIEEQNKWFEASDKERLKPYMSAQLVKNEVAFVDAPFGMGEVLHTGRIHSALLMTSYTNYLKKQRVFYNERFHYESLEVIDGKYFSYKGLNAKNILFCEGFGLRKNPFFNYLPLTGTKGEVLDIQAKVTLQAVLKSGVFIMPLENDQFKIGATYNRKDKTNTPTPEGRQELKTKLERFFKKEYKVLAHQAGIRPTVKDRRPLVGEHPKHKNMFVLNGLGSRGVMVAPYIAKQLYQFITTKQPLEHDININRYIKQRELLT